MAPPDLSNDRKVPLPLEVAVFGGGDALRAQILGAKRVELNAVGSYDDGGTTPKLEELTGIASQLEVPVRVMIRPRGPPQEGPDFVYTEAEFDLMQRTIMRFKDAEVMNPLRGDGFVFGLLKRPPPADARHPEEHLVVDMPRCAELVELAKPFRCVFHRAFDEIAASRRWEGGLSQLIAAGFEGVLTAGGTGTYYDNVKRLMQMFRLTEKSPLQLIVGGGVRAANVSAPAVELVQLRRCSLWMHTACIAKTVKYPDGELDTDELNRLLGALGMATPD